MKEIKKKNNNQVIIEQLRAMNLKTKTPYLVTTGATFNNEHYLTTPVIIGRYVVSDVTLRKKYMKEGIIFKDFIPSDGKILISESFLSKHNFKLIPQDKLVRNSITKEHHVGEKFPYSKPIKQNTEKLKKQNINDPVSQNKQLIIKELKKMHWDEFITISTSYFMDQNAWDIAILDFCDYLALKSKSLGIRVAYSTELSIDIRHKRVSKYDNSHRHIHLFLNYGGAPVEPKTLKELFLKAMRYPKFKRYEYEIEPFKKDSFGENYILKTYKNETDCFSLCAPNQSILKDLD
jgi:hypothetical protein